MAKSLSLFTGLILLGGCLTACSAEYWTGRIKPGTWVEFDPQSRRVRFEDTKENTIRISGLQVDGEAKTMILESLEILNQSAPVIAADAERMQYVIEGQKLQAEYVRQVWTGLALAISAGGDAVSRYLGALPRLDVQVDTPWGSGSGSMIPTPPCVEGPGDATPDG